MRLIQDLRIEVQRMSSNETNKKERIISIEDLSIYFESREIGVCKAVNNFSLDINKGETLGLVGETGSGKTTVALSIMRLLQSPPGEIKNGHIYYDGKDILEFSREELHRFRGRSVSMIFQDPMTALNPIETIGDQVAEVIRIHNDDMKENPTEQAIKMLEMVGLSKDRFNEYPCPRKSLMYIRLIPAWSI